MVESLLLATALRTENITERVIHSHDISNLVKMESESVLQLWKEDLEATSKYLDAKCSQKSYNITVRNLKLKMSSENNLCSIKDALNACELSKDLPPTAAKDQIVQALLCAYENTLTNKSGRYVCNELDTVTDRISGKRLKDKRLYFWTCGYSFNVQGENERSHLNTSAHIDGGNKCRLLCTLNVTVLSCDVTRFDKLTADLNENFSETRKKIRQLYPPPNFLGILNGSFAVNFMSCTQLCGLMDDRNTTALNSSVVNNVISNSQLVPVSSTTISSTQPSQKQQQLYKKLLEFSENRANIIYNLALIIPVVQSTVIHDVLYRIEGYAKYIFGYSSFTYIMNENVLVVYDARNEKNFSRINRYEYIEQGNAINMNLRIERFQGVCAQDLPISVENWLVYLYLTKKYT